MITSLRRMWTCHWAAHRIGRYLDHDPSVPLSDDEVRRLEAHLAVCRKCTGVVEEQRALGKALGRWSQRRQVDEASLSRMHQLVDRLTSGKPQ